MFPPTAVAHNFNELKKDVVTLLRLQAELFQADLEECSRNVWRPSAVCLAALVIALGAVPILLLGLAEALTAATTMAHYLSLGIVALAALIGAGVALYFGSRRLGKAASAFRRSQEEFRRNLQWLKDSLGQDWVGPHKTSSNGKAYHDTAEKR